MVSTASASSNSRYRAGTGLGYDGVVRVSTGSFYGTGALLADGLHVLTAAHLLVDSSSATVYFETSAGTFERNSQSILIHPDYNDDNVANDLALIRLSSPAPISANRYQLLRDGLDAGENFVMVGYGASGTGTLGITDTDPTPLRRLAKNTFDGEMSVMKSRLGDVMGWSPPEESQLFADFDDGSYSRDASGRLLSLSHLGLGVNEGMLSRGDSGGPAFIDGMLAGVASYGVSLEQGSIRPDPDGETNSSFGEFGVWQRLSAYAQWIDQSMRDSWTGVPRSPQEVQRSLSEGNSGARLVYFLVQYGNPGPDGGSVDYRTVDGTAKAGEDYLAVTGRLVFYPGESNAVIPVEVIGDTRVEGDETFYLEIFNPVGGSFPAGQTTLRAMRTIIDDDQPLLLAGLAPQDGDWPLG